MLNPKDFIHPEDEAAMRNMQAIPGFSAAVKNFLKFGYEKLLGGITTASCIKLSPTQLPEIYNRLPPICKKLSIAVPEFYLEMNPMPNAYTFGDTKIFVVVTSGLLEYLDDDEINSVLAHECGHIACRHVLYHMMATLLVDGMGLFSKLFAPIKYALLYWQRKSELSCDRAAALVVGVDSVVETHVRLSGGPKSITSNVNLEEWIAQAELYEEIRDGNIWNKTVQIVATMGNSHPFSAVRVREILKWGQSNQYQMLIQSIERQENEQLCPNCYKIIIEDWRYCKYCGTILKN